jgi:hypothetical protein
MEEGAKALESCVGTKQKSNGGSIEVQFLD